MRYRSLFYGLFLLFLTACSVSDHEFVLKGNIKNMRNSEIYVVTPGGEHAGMDTIQVKGDEFEYRITVTQPTVLLLQYKNYQQFTVFAEPGKKATLKGDNGSLPSVEVKGTPENESFTAYRLSVLGKTDTEKRKAADEYIRRQPESLSACYLLQRLFFNEEADPDKALELARLVRDAQPENVQAGQLYTFMQNVLNNAKGKSIVPFTLTDIDGKKFSITDYKKSKKNLLVIFWADWDTESTTLLNVMEMQIRQMRSEDKEVPVELITVSLDGNRYDWQRRMKRRELPGRHTILTDAWENPVVKRWNVNQVPYALLYDTHLKVKKHLYSREDILKEIH